MKKPKQTESQQKMIIHSSAAEYLTFVAATGDTEESFEIRGRNRGRFRVLTEKQRMTYNEPGDATWQERQEQWETAEFIT